jgi:3',5'-cyclic AMP phosphodiesterase CpdA
VLIAQITDTHIKPEGSLAYGHVDTSAFLARAVDHILHLDPRPDVVLGTGDLVDGGTPRSTRDCAIWCRRCRGRARLAGRAGVTRRRGVEQERWFAFPTFQGRTRS